MVKKVLVVVAVVLGVLVVGLGVAVVVLSSKLEERVAFPQAPLPELRASTDPAVIAQGEYVVRTAGHCTQCHGDYERARPADNTPTVALTGGFAFKLGPLGTLYSANLTPDVDTGIGRRSDQELARTLTTGVLANGQLSFFMRYAASDLSQEDVVAVISYLRSLQPVKRQVPVGGLTRLGKAAFATRTFSADLAPSPAHVPAGPAPSVERGEYLAQHVALCVSCHSRVDATTFLPTGPRAGGGDPDASPGESDADMEFVAPNLTSHPTGVTGKLSEEQFVERLQAGRAYPFSRMPWENLSRMSQGDLRSIYRFLRQLPPVDHDVGPTYRTRGSYGG